MVASPAMICGSTRIKVSYTTGHVDWTGVGPLPVPDHSPVAGDLVLARVDAVGHHKVLESPGGRRTTLFPGDRIVVPYGHRYATDQYEALVPGDWDACHLVAGGGVASRVISANAAMGAPTAIEPIGPVGDASGRQLNLRDFALAMPPVPAHRPFTIASVGTAMNSGKTFSAASLIRGMTAAGLRVGAAKVTGTGAGKDLFLFSDSGADPVLDFTAAGYASTYLATTDQILAIADLLVARLTAAGVDAIVLEVADGVYQQETAEVLPSARFRHLVDGYMFSAGDALGGVAGVRWLQEHGLPVVGVSGVLSTSQLTMTEVRQATNVEVFDTMTLADPSILYALQWQAVRTVAA